MVYWQKDVKRRANTYDVTETSFTDVGAFDSPRATAHAGRARGVLATCRDPECALAGLDPPSHAALHLGIQARLSLSITEPSAQIGEETLAPLPLCLRLRIASRVIVPSQRFLP